MRYLWALAVVVCGGVSLVGAGGCGDDDEGDGGTAGSAGSGGASGSGGSGGGTGGTAGGGGGSGGSTGSGGSGTGGAGGTGGGGPCQECVEGACGADWTACEADADCAEIFQCFVDQNCEATPEPRACADDCVAQSPDGETLFNPVFDCADSNCITPCGG
jgi:hypothetical protein